MPEELEEPEEHTPPPSTAHTGRSEEIKACFGTLKVCTARTPLSSIPEVHRCPRQQCPQQPWPPRGSLRPPVCMLSCIELLQHCSTHCTTNLLQRLVTPCSAVRFVAIVLVRNLQIVKNLQACVPCGALAGGRERKCEMGCRNCVGLRELHPCCVDRDSVPLSTGAVHFASMAWLGWLGWLGLNASL